MIGLIHLWWRARSLGECGWAWLRAVGLRWSRRLGWVLRLASIQQRIPALAAALAVAWFAQLAPASSAHRPPADAPRVNEGDVDVAPLPRGYDTFDAGWLHLAYPPSLSRWVEPLIEEARAFRTEASLRLGQQVLTRVRVRLAEDPTQMATLAPIGAPYPKYAVGVAYSGLDLILLTERPVHANSEHDLVETFRHELAHLALEEAVSGARVPLWFNEGLAIHLARERAFGRTQTLWTAVVSGNLLSLNDIVRHFPDDIVGVPLAYAQSADVVRYLLRQEDAERFRLLIKKLRRGEAFDDALSDSYGLDTYSLERVWRADVESRYTVWPVVMSGSVIWGGAIVLAALAWRRKKKRQERTLRRWAREEALEEFRRMKAVQSKQPMASSGADFQHGLVFTRETPLPKVEHDGDWHTLH